MKKFEYKIETYRVYNPEYEINEIGKEAWELISVLGHRNDDFFVFYFKREIVE